LIATLPNLRLVCLPSQHLGEDWDACVRRIDAFLQDNDFDLAEEAVYLIFDRAPAAALSGEGSCVVGRPVIGPKRRLDLPFLQEDRVASSVFLEDLAQNDWPGMLGAAQLHWERLQRENHSLRAGFMLKFARLLTPQLELKRQVYYYE
jgi:hypothetical protein